MKNLILSFLLLSQSANAFVADRGHWASFLSNEREDIKNEEPVTRELGDGMRELDIEAIAKKILYIQKSMDEKYAVADAVGFTFFIIKTFSDMGNYELVQADIKRIIEIVVNLIDIELTPEVSIILDQVEKIRFGQYEGKRSAVIFGINGRDIVLPLNQKGEPGSSIKEIKHIRFKNGIRLQFKEMTSVSDKTNLHEFLKEVIKIPLLPKDWFGALNQIHPDMLRAYPAYRNNKEIAALEVNFNGASVLVDTSTVLKTMDLNIEQGYFLPNLRVGDNRAPSLVLELKSKMIRLKISIDQ